MAWVCLAAAAGFGFASWRSNPAPDPQQRQEPPPAPGPSAPSPVDAVLLEIQALNDAIPGAAMSRQIERIRVLTAQILAHRQADPSVTADLSRFLNYYLPTTLKLLRVYAQLDAQEVEGENISAAKTRIEQMMDTVIQGFEAQLDKLFAGQVLDITTDIQVMQRALLMDGLIPHDAMEQISASGASAPGG